jgi:hypothetical protein
MQLTAPTVSSIIPSIRLTHPVIPTAHLPLTALPALLKTVAVSYALLAINLIPHSFAQLSAGTEYWLELSSVTLEPM